MFLRDLGGCQTRFWARVSDRFAHLRGVRGVLRTRFGHLRHAPNARFKYAGPVPTFRPPSPIIRTPQPLETTVPRMANTRLPNGHAWRDSASNCADASAFNFARNRQASYASPFLIPSSLAIEPYARPSARMVAMCSAVAVGMIRFS